MSAPAANPTLLAREAPSPCACSICVSFCARPCWPSPEEAERLMDAGYVKKLMLDWWEADERIYIVSPALLGHEGDEAPEMSMFDAFMGFPALKKGCALHEKATGRCLLHDAGLKPIEGRLSDHTWPKNDGVLHEAVAALWDTDKGRAVVDRWRKETA